MVVKERDLAATSAARPAVKVKSGDSCSCASLCLMEGCDETLGVGWAGVGRETQDRKTPAGNRKTPAGSLTNQRKGAQNHKIQ